VRLILPALGATLNDLFARVDYTDDQELEKAIEKTGHSIKDVKAVIMRRLHLDRAGGLVHFKGTDVPIYVHELELKNTGAKLVFGHDEGQFGGFRHAPEFYH
jgi:hypothetical protein